MPRVWPRYGDARARLAANLSPPEPGREQALSPPSSSGSARDSTHNPVSPASAPVGSPSPQSSSEKMRCSTGQLTPVLPDRSLQRRGTAAASLPQRDPVTRKRLWPKLGGYEPIKVPASSRFLSSDSESDDDDRRRAAPLRARTQSPPPSKLAYSPPTKTVAFDLEGSSHDRAKSQETDVKHGSRVNTPKIGDQRGINQDSAPTQASGASKDEARKLEEGDEVEARTREEAEKLRREQRAKQEQQEQQEREKTAKKAHQEREFTESRNRERREREAQAKLEEERMAKERSARAEEESRDREARARAERAARDAAAEEQRQRSVAEAEQSRKEIETKEKQSREALEREKVKNAELLQREREVFEREKAKMKRERKELEAKLREKVEADSRKQNSLPGPTLDQGAANDQVKRTAIVQSTLKCAPNSASTATTVTTVRTIPPLPREDITSLVTPSLASVAVEGSSAAIVFSALLAASMCSCAVQCLGPDELPVRCCGLLLPLRTMHDGYWPLLGQWLLGNIQVVIAFEAEGLVYANALWTALAMTCASVLCVGSEDLDWSAGPTSLPFVALGITQVVLAALTVIRSSPVLQRLSVEEGACAIVAALCTTCMVGCAASLLEPATLEAGWGGATCRGLSLRWIGDVAVLRTLHTMFLLGQLLATVGITVETLTVALSGICGLVMAAGAVLLLGDAREREGGLPVAVHFSLASTQLFFAVCTSLVSDSAEGPRRRPQAQSTSYGVVVALLSGGVAAWMTQTAVSLLGH